MIKGNYYMKQHLQIQKLKASIKSLNTTTMGKISFKGVSGIKPIKWTGTQRSAFTHRNNQKRIRTIIDKEKENYVKRAEKREIKRAEYAAKKEIVMEEVEAKADAEMFEDVEE